MRIGLALPHYDFSSPDGAPVTWDSLAGWARRAESLGYDSVWISDHYFLSLARYGGPDERYGSPEAMTALAALAAVTERVRLGALVLAAGFRHPALLAKEAVTVDLLSEGRLEVGLGAGWYEAEYEAFGHPFGSPGERFEVLEETVEVLARLWGEEEPVTWQGNRFRLSEAYCRPRPAQPGGPPIWIGGKGGPRLLRLVAERAAGWNTVWTWTPEAYAERARALDDASERRGRDPSSIRRSVGLYTLVGEDEADARSRWDGFLRWAPGGAFDGASLDDWSADTLAGGVDQAMERLGAFARLNVEEVVVNPAPLPFAVADPEMVDLIAERIIPAAREL
jgi:probable F420-dependent oxidoreductase